MSSSLLCLALIAACHQTPEQAADHVRRGDAALAAGRIGQAMVAYGLARELAPQDPLVQRALLRARVYMMASTPERVPPEGIEETRYAAQLLLETEKGKEAIYLTAQGNLLARQRDVEGAKAKFAEALKADPNSVVAHTAFAQVLMSSKEGLAKAKTELDVALKAKPDHQPALLALGQIKLAEGDLPAAAERLEAALAQQDDFPVRMSLGTVRVQQQKPADAVPHFQRAAQLDPKSPDALRSLGQALLSTGNADEAERALRAAAQMRADANTLIALGFALDRLKKPDQALGVFEQILAQEPGAAPALFGAGAASEGLGRNDKALAYYERLAAVKAEGNQKQMIVDLQKDAQARVTAIRAAAPAPTGSASAGAPNAGAAAPPKR